MASERWSAYPLEAELRSVLRSIAPEVAELDLRWAQHLHTSNPLWCSATAALGSAAIAKFAWSPPSAERIRREAALLELLGELSSLPVPPVLGASDEPAVLVTARVEGAPVSWADTAELSSANRDRFGRQVGHFLAELHHPDLLAAVRERNEALKTPEPQALPDGLRSRLSPLVGGRRGELVTRWADWAEEVLAPPWPVEALLHGDLHSFNEVWDHQTWTLGAVVDFEVAGPGDPNFDFRYLPSHGPTPEITRAAIAEYERGGDSVDTNRIMGWHVLTTLGDALWRTEAGVELPGGGTAYEWVDDLEQRLPEYLGDCP